MTGSIIVRKRLSYSAVPDAVLEHRTLSATARLVLGWLLGRPDGWEIRVGPMCRRLRLSAKTWPKVRDELVANGFFKQARYKGAAGRIVWHHEVTDGPLYAVASTIPPKREDGATIPPKRMDGDSRDAAGRDKAVHRQSDIKEAAAQQHDAAAFRISKVGGVLHGVEFWSAGERSQIEALAESVGVDALQAAAQQAALQNANGRSYLSAVSAILTQHKREQATIAACAAADARRHEADAKALAEARADGECTEAGRAFLERVRRKRHCAATTGG